MTPVSISLRNGLYFNTTFSRNRFFKYISRNPLTITMHVLLMGGGLNPRASFT